MSQSGRLWLHRRICYKNKVWLGESSNKCPKTCPLLQEPTSLKSRGALFNTFVRSSMLYGSKCWASKLEDMKRMKKNECSMLRWICGWKPDDKKGPDSIYKELELPSMEDSLRLSRLGWYGHVQHSDGWIRRCTDMQIAGRAPRGKPKKT